MIKGNFRIKSQIQQEGELLHFLPKTAKLPVCHQWRWHLPPRPFRQLPHPAPLAAHPKLLWQLCGYRRACPTGGGSKWAQLPDQRTLHHSVAHLPQPKTEPLPHCRSWV
jgi:hypothetical protein